MSLASFRLSLATCSAHWSRRPRRRSPRDSGPVGSEVFVFVVVVWGRFWGDESPEVEAAAEERFIGGVGFGWTGD